MGAKMDFSASCVARTIVALRIRLLPPAPTRHGVRSLILGRMCQFAKTWVSSIAPLPAFWVATISLPYAWRLAVAALTVLHLSAPFQMPPLCKNTSVSVALTEQVSELLGRLRLFFPFAKSSFPPFLPRQA